MEKQSIELKIDELTQQIDQTLIKYNKNDITFLVEFIRTIGMQMDNYEITFLYPQNFVIYRPQYISTVSALESVLIQLGVINDELISKVFNAYKDAIHNVNLAGLL